MVKVFEGNMQAHVISDYYGNDRPFIDVYDKPTNKDLYDLTKCFHGKKVRIIIEEIEEVSE